MTDTTRTAPVASKTKTSDLERLKTLVLKIAKGIVKNPLTDEAREEMSKVASLIFSTVNHSEMLSEHGKTTSETEVE